MRPMLSDQRMFYEENQKVYYAWIIINVGLAVSNFMFGKQRGAWTVVLVSLDNVSVWNVRVENLVTLYLVQETYVKTVNPEDNSNKIELWDQDAAIRILKHMEVKPDLVIGNYTDGNLVASLWKLSSEVSIRLRQ